MAARGLQSKKIKGKWVLLLGVPALTLWFMFILLPALWGVLISFTNEALVGKNALNPQFVGFANYIKLFKDAHFINSVQKSFLFVFFSAIIGQAGLGLLLAYLTRRRRKKGDKPPLLGNITSTVVFLGWITPEAVAGLMWLSVLDKNGFFNQVFNLSGNWFVSSPLIAIILINIWGGTAWSMTLLRSAIETVSHEIEESAMVDGASKWQTFRYIILPIIRGPILVNLILITIWTYGVFGVPYMLTRGGPGRMTELMTIYAYNTGFKHFEIGYGATISVATLLITLVFSLLYFRFLQRKSV